ncbi:MAG TPA: hypothetical protein PLQ01_06630 [Methanothrix sp.]|nr:hypothetical protein [Methanothrix sp.]HOV82339.1 hypothetical protein [Methanothrix sp.]
MPGAVAITVFDGPGAVLDGNGQAGGGAYIDEGSDGSGGYYLATGIEAHAYTSDGAWGMAKSAYAGADSQERTINTDNGQVRLSTGYVGTVKAGVEKDTDATVGDMSAKATVYSRAGFYDPSAPRQVWGDAEIYSEISSTSRGEGYALATGSANYEAKRVNNNADTLHVKGSVSGSSSMWADNNVKAVSGSPSTNLYGESKIVSASVATYPESWSDSFVEYYGSAKRVADRDGYAVVWGDANGAGEASAWDVTTPAGQSHIPGSENAYSKASGKVSGTQEVYTNGDYTYGEAYINSNGDMRSGGYPDIYAYGILYTSASAIRVYSTSDDSAKDVYSAVYLYNGDITSFAQQGGLKASQSANTGATDTQFVDGLNSGAHLVNEGDVRSSANYFQWVDVYDWFENINPNVHTSADVRSSMNAWPHGATQTLNDAAGSWMHVVGANVKAKDLTNVISTSIANQYNLHWIEGTHRTIPYYDSFTAPNPATALSRDRTVIDEMAISGSRTVDRDYETYQQLIT